MTAAPARTDLLQGTLDVLILKTLALYRLEAKGWIGSEWGNSENNRRARFYELTRAGRKQLSEETESWERFAAAVGRVLEAS